jgi:hypothetical protein
MAKAGSQVTTPLTKAIGEGTRLITSRRNFLVRALGFTAAGAAVSLPVVAMDDADTRIRFHLGEIEKAFREIYGPAADVRVHGNCMPVRFVQDPEGFYVANIQVTARHRRAADYDYSTCVPEPGVHRWGD